MKATILLLSLELLFYTQIKAQGLNLIKEVKITTPIAVSLDRYGNIYSGDERGNVYKFDSTGTPVSNFSAQKVASISAIEAWQTLHVFVFYRDTQEFTTLNRFLTPLTLSTPINPEVIGFARAATLGMNENLWVFDDTDFSLKKYELSSQSLSLHTPLSLLLSPSEYSINFMREYQNMVFINDKNSGILVFDNLGNYKKKLPFAGLNYFGFSGNNLYFLQEGKIQLFDLYHFSEKSINLPSKYSYLFALLSENKLILFTKNSFQIYQVSN